MYYIVKICFANSVSFKYRSNQILIILNQSQFANGV